MIMLKRLVVCGLAVLGLLGIVLLSAAPSPGTEFDGDWLYEDLTCEELQSAYFFEAEVLEQIVESYKQCLAFYAESPPEAHGDLHCALIKREGLFVESLVNDLVDVFNSKPGCTDVQ